MSWSVKPSEDVNKTLPVPCGSCQQKTQHRILAAIDYSGESDSGDIHVWGSAQVIQCQGCEAIGFRDVSTCSENIGPEGPEQDERLYPERPKRSVTDELYLRQDVYDVPDIIQIVYRETLAAVQHDLPTLAGIGIRAVIEATCQHLKATGRNLEIKIDKLAELSYLTPAGSEILHGIRLIGNDAAHEIKAPSIKQITAALKVIDHLLLGVFVLPQEASVLPKRQPKQAKNVNSKTASSQSSTGGATP